MYHLSTSPIENIYSLLAEMNEVIKKIEGEKVFDRTHQNLRIQQSRK